jgi:hypothetical protein
MKDVVIPTKPDRKDGIMKELEWREQWRLYSEQFTGIQNDYKIRILLKWFKEDFFQWVNNPYCPVCKVAARKRGVADCRAMKREMWESLCLQRRKGDTKSEVWSYGNVRNVGEMNDFHDTTILSNFSPHEKVDVVNLPTYFAHTVYSTDNSVLHSWCVRQEFEHGGYGIQKTTSG